MVLGLKEKERLRETFGLHVRPEAAAQILERDPGASGTERYLTIMFVDIRGFTAICRGRTPHEVVAILNEFLTEMVDVVQRQHGGMVNKYLGDGFMALFAAGGERDDHADTALRAAQGILERLNFLNQRFQARRMVRLAIGIGIHSGTG
jgi:adenylate cyclase